MRLLENDLQSVENEVVFLLVFLHLIPVYQLCTYLVQYISLLLERENICA